VREERSIGLLIRERSREERDSWIKTIRMAAQISLMPCTYPEEG
jgi:hypothetical protein